jgi:hypothetical protein
MTMPQDLTDLYLSPVAIAVDKRLEELGRCPQAELNYRLAVETNSTPRLRVDAIAAVVADAGYLVDTHHWRLVWDPRGLRLSNDDHSIVLGVPDNVRDYVNSFPVSR